MTADHTVDAHRPGGVGLVLGALVAASRLLTDPREATNGTTQSRPPDPRYVALGAMWAAEDRLTDLARAAAGATRAVGAPVVDMALPLVPRSVRRAVANLARKLDEQGRTAAATGTDEVERFAERFSEGLSRDPNVLHVVEQFVDELQWRVVDSVLPVVLERLAAEPEQVRAIVQGQSRGMVEEVTTTVRSRAATGDEAVDRLVARLLNRRHTRGDGPGRHERPALSSPPGGVRPPDV